MDRCRDHGLETDPVTDINLYATDDGLVIDQGGIIDRAARLLFYSAEWNRPQALAEPVIRHMIDCEGIPESDIRDMRYVHTYDAVIIRTWNWRKFIVTGIHQFQHEIQHQAMKGK